MYNQVRRSIPHLDTGEKLAAGERSWNMKEKFYWCEKGSRGQGYPLHKTGYLDHYDECPNFRMANKEKDERGGAWDVFPPLYLPPKPFRVRADHTASMLEDPNVPGRLVEAFGQMSKLLTFIVLLKSEPSEIVRSWLYMSQRNGWVGSSGGKYSSEQLRNQLERYENQVDECETEQGLDIGSCVVKTQKGECFRQAAYGPLLRVWLEHFEPRQFILIESEYFFEHARANNGGDRDAPRSSPELRCRKYFEICREKSSTNVNKRKPSVDDAEALTVIRKRIEPGRVSNPFSGNDVTTGSVVHWGRRALFPAGTPDERGNDEYGRLSVRVVPTGVNNLIYGICNAFALTRVRVMYGAPKPAK